MKKNNEQKKLIMLFIGAFLIMIFMMIFSHKAKAQGEYFPMEQNENNNITSYVLDFINSDNDIDVNNNYVVVGKTQVTGNYTSVYVLTCSKENNYIFAEKLSNGYQFSYYLLNGANGAFSVWEVKYRTSNPSNVFKNNFTSSGLNYFVNLDSSIYNANVSYVSNLKVYTSANSDKQLVLKYGQEETPIDIGVAIIPPDAIIPDYPSGTTPPAQVPPAYTPNDYQWTTPPTFDGSTVTNAIGSVQNTLGWLANNLKEEFKNITDNGKHFFEYIGKTIQYYGNTIIETLNNLMKNFYDNMKSLVEPIYTKIESLYNDFLDFADLFINPFDEEEFEQQIDDCKLITRYNELLENCEVIQQIFDETSEPDSFILYIDFENPFADSEHKIIASEINFNWLVPLRPVYRPFLTVFTLIECFVGGFRILGNIIGGKAK